MSLVIWVDTAHMAFDNTVAHKLRPQQYCDNAPHGPLLFVFVSAGSDPPLIRRRVSRRQPYADRHHKFHRRDAGHGSHSDSAFVLLSACVVKFFGWLDRK